MAKSFERDLLSWISSEMDGDEFWSKWVEWHLREWANPRDFRMPPMVLMIGDYHEIARAYVEETTRLIREAKSNRSCVRYW